MHPLHLARAATFLVVVVGGGLAGHLFMPVRGGVVLWSRLIGFLLLMAVLGAFRGWREGVVHGEAAARVRRRSIIYCGVAVLAAVLGFLVIHGPPIG